MSAKKVVCLIEDLNSGGAERQLTGLAILLKQSGYDVEVWTYYPGDFYLHDLIDAGVKYRYIASAQNKFRRIPALRKELSKFNPDTVIAYLDTACIVACIIKLLGGKFNLIVSERNTTQKLSFKERLKFFCYRFADHIVPNSYSQTGFVGSHYPNLTKKLTCITNFIDTDRFSPSNDKIDSKSVRILTAARIMPQKNIKNYIRAVRQVIERGYNVHVDWYGQRFDGDYYGECVKIIAECGLQNIFRFHEPKKDIIRQYRSSDLFCLPSYYEGFPNVVCEAMSCGLPVVCSNVCDNPRLVIPGVNGYLFTPDSVEDMADALSEFLSLDMNTRSKFSTASRDMAMTMFSKTSFITKYKNIIDE